MASAIRIPLEEYLTSVYEPDCDYVDGEVQDRYLGEFDHSTLQVMLIGELLRVASQFNIRIKSELRMRLSPTRYRIPDILVMRQSQRFERVLTSPPFLCIEIVSPEDRMSRITAKVREYLDFGVEYVWVIDPQTSTAWQHTASGSIAVTESLTTTNPDLSISISGLFAELARERGEAL